MSTIIDLGKIRFQFRGDYSASEAYEYNDVVKYGGDVYVFNSTAASGTAPTVTTHWSSMVSGLKARGPGRQVRRIKSITSSRTAETLIGQQLLRQAMSRQTLPTGSCWQVAMISRVTG